MSQIISLRATMDAERLDLDSDAPILLTCKWTPYEAGCYSGAYEDAVEETLEDLEIFNVELTNTENHETIDISWVLRVKETAKYLYEIAEEALTVFKDEQARLSVEDAF